MIETRLMAVALLAVARCAAADSPPKLTVNSSGSLLAMDTRVNAEATAPKGALTMIAYGQGDHANSKVPSAFEQARWTEPAVAYDPGSAATERRTPAFDSVSASWISPKGDIDEVGFLAGDVAPVPEPSTWLAGLLAFVGVALSQRRRFTGQPHCR